MKRRLLKLTVLALSALLIFGSTSAFAKQRTGQQLQEIEEIPFPETVEGEADGAGFVIMDFDGPVSFHTELQKAVLEAGYKKVNKICKGQEEYSIPRGVVITWKNETAGDAAYVVSVASSEDMADAVVYEVTEAANENGVYNYPVQNLLLGQTYYFNITADGDKVSDTHSFTVDDVTPRNLFVEGVTNFRDLGGWTTADGKKVKQGLVYRCAQLNTDGTEEACFTEAGMDTMLNTLGIKMEIDLRMDETMIDENGGVIENGGIHESVLGDSVKYVSLPFVAAEELSKETDKVKVFFDLLADPENYPLAFHCKIGTDRTGSLAFLLLGFLGVSEDDIYTDFTFSNTGNIGSPRSIDRINKYAEGYFDAAGGDTVQETCRNYLLGIGMTEEQLQTIYDIMIEQ